MNAFHPVAAACILVATSWTTAVASESTTTEAFPTQALSCAFSLLKPVSGHPAGSFELVLRNHSASIRSVAPPTRIAADEEARPKSVLFVEVIATNQVAQRFYFSTTNHAFGGLARDVELQPGATYTNVYNLREFYRWGPCGPDTGGSFGTYFTSGAQPLRLRVGWVPDMSEAPTNQILSDSVDLFAAYPAWMFRLR